MLAQGIGRIRVLRWQDERALDALLPITNGIILEGPVTGWIAVVLLRDLSEAIVTPDLFDGIATRPRVTPLWVTLVRCPIS